MLNGAESAARISSETRPSSVSEQREYLILCDQQLYSQRSCGMCGLHPQRRKDTKNNSNRRSAGLRVRYTWVWERLPSLTRIKPSVRTEEH